MATHEVLVDTRGKNTHTWLILSTLAGRIGYVPGVLSMHTGDETDCRAWIRRRVDAYNTCGGTAYWFDADHAFMGAPPNN